jgi:hypothetical protein
LVYAAEIAVGPHVFRHKYLAREHIQGILRRNHLSRVTDPEEHEFLVHLLQRHPLASQKIGVGISHFTVDKSYEKRPPITYCFHVHRTDGTSTDFSYRWCLDSKAPNQGMGAAQLPKQYWTESLRGAVYPQTHRFKVAAFADCDFVTCPISGEEIQWDEAHVHHEPPHTFVALVDGWLAQEGITISEVELSSADKTSSGELGCSKQLASWQQYHKEHARLQVVSARANMSSKYKSRATSSKGKARKAKKSAR